MLTINDVIRLAKGAHSLPALRSVVFDGKSAICASEMDWIVGVPCLQPALSAPVVVPVEALQAHMAKSRHLVVMPDHLTNGQGLVTPFGKNPKTDYDSVLAMLPPLPTDEAVSFDLELDALDRVLIAAGKKDIRYYLNGVLMDLSAGALVATDGNRLHAYMHRVPKAFPKGEPVALVVARQPLRWALGSASEAARVTVWNARGRNTVEAPGLPQLLLQCEDGFVWVRKPIEGRYPDWRRVLPAVTTRPVWMELNPVALANAVEAVGKVAALDSKGKSRVVVVDFGAGSVVPGMGGEGLPFDVALGSDRAELDVESVRAALCVAVQGPFVQDMADCVTGSAQWRLDLSQPGEFPLLVTDGDFTGVVMPYRLKAPQPVVPVPDTAQDSAPEEAPEPEPCPAAVAAVVAQLVGRMKEPAPKAAKPAKARKAEPVAA